MQVQKNYAREKIPIILQFIKRNCEVIVRVNFESDDIIICNYDSNSNESVRSITKSFWKRDTDVETE